MCLTEDQHAIQELAAQGADEALADRVHARSLDCGRQDPGAGGLEDGVERGGEVRAAVADQESDVLEPLAEGQGEVAGLLHRPARGRRRGAGRPRRRVRRRTATPPAILGTPDSSRSQPRPAGRTCPRCRRPRPARAATRPTRRCPTPARRLRGCRWRGGPGVIGRRVLGARVDGDRSGGGVVGRVQVTWIRTAVASGSTRGAWRVSSPMSGGTPRRRPRRPSPVARCRGR